MAQAPAVVPVDYDIPTGIYASFIEDFRAKLANHPNPEDVNGHPVLAKQLMPKEPARWMHINLSAGEKEQLAEATLAVRDDNVYLIGFKAKSGKWYEFGFKDKSVPMIPGSTFLECDVDYKSLVGGSTSKQVKMNLVKMVLGKSFAEEAACKLSGYVQSAPLAPPDDATKLDLARLIVMVCESARMISISNTVNDGWDQKDGSKISERQVDYLWNWGLMSQALLGWKKYGEKYKWPKNLKAIGIKTAADALAVVQLLLNKPPLPPQLSPSAADNDEDEGRTAWHLHAAADNDGHGQPLVEVFAVRAGFRVVGTVAVFDGRRGQVMYKRDRHLQEIHDSQKGEMVLTGPYKAITAYGSFAIQVDIDSAGELSATGESSNAGGTLYWDCYDDDDANAVYDAPWTRAISTAHGPVEVTYAVLSNAVEATVQVRLLLAAPAPDALVYGRVTARSKAFDVPSVLFSRGSEERVAVAASDGSNVPLSRSVVAVPLHTPLVVEASLHAAAAAAAGSNQEREGIIQGALVFYPELDGEHLKSVFTEHGEVLVKVTWSDI